MINDFIKFILIFLLAFTPIVFGAADLWAFSVMELGILLMIILWTIQKSVLPPQSAFPSCAKASEGERNPWPPKLSERRRPHSAISLNSELRTSNSPFCFILLSLFLLLVLFQMIPLPSGVVKIISPKTFTLRNSLTFDLSPLTFQLSLFPFATRIEFFKWFALSGFFLFLLNWRPSDRRDMHHLVPVVMLVGIAESLYGMFEFFSGHRHILNLDVSSLVSSVTGTFINRNYFAGYLLMVIPLSMGFLFSREGFQKSRFRGWRFWLSSLDGKALLIAFGIVVMILALLFSASRMGIMSLLLSFSLISLLYRDPRREKRFSKTSVLLFGLALLWAAWIGLDAVISRFFSLSEGFEERWKIWVSTFQIFKDFPLFGSGLGTFAQIFPMYRSFHIHGMVTHAENDFLQLASNVGIIGIGLLLILFSILFYKGVSGIRSLSSREPERYIGMGCLVGILALLFHSIVERNIQVPANAFLFTFLLATVLTISIQGTKRTKEAGETRQPKWTRETEET